MTIVHIIESGGGSMNFVIYMINYIKEHNHIVIYSERTFGMPIEELRNKYSIPHTVQFIEWKYAQREMHPYKDIKATNYLYKLLKSLNFDAVHLHSSKAGFIGRIVCRWLKFENVIYTTHAVSFFRKDVSSFTNKLFVLLEKLANKASGRIICCSKSESDELKKYNIKSTYINNGTEIYDGRNFIVDFKKTKFRVVSIGRATIQKNPHLFNEIAKQFEEDDSIEFIWIGNGELENILTSRNIKVTGWLDRNGIDNELANADLYISTATWEGMPLAVLEAMNLKKPLLLSNCVGNVDLVIEGFNGFIFNNLEEAVEKIQYFSENKLMLKRFGENSRSLCEQKFNIIDTAKKYEQEYQKFYKSIPLRSKREYMDKKYKYK